MDRHSTIHSSQYEDAEVALVGVWMSDDVNPKLIHRVALSSVNTGTLEKFTDKDGYLYGTFSSMPIPRFWRLLVKGVCPSILRSRAYWSVVRMEVEEPPPYPNRLLPVFHLNAGKIMLFISAIRKEHGVQSL